jgi:hypothetical protein
VFHCRADDKDLKLELTVPKGSAGTVRIYVIDPDQFQGGRKQEILVTGKSLGVVEGFDTGKWLECPLMSEQTQSGKVLITARNLRNTSNAVISIVEWIGNTN